MGLLDDAIREHLDLKRRRGADPAEIERAERDALGPVRRDPVGSDEADLEHAALPDDHLDHEHNAAFDHGFEEPQGLEEPPQFDAPPASDVSAATEPPAVTEPPTAPPPELEYTLDQETEVWDAFEPDGPGLVDSPREAHAAPPPDHLPAEEKPPPAPLEEEPIAQAPPEPYAAPAPPEEPYAAPAAPEELREPEPRDLDPHATQRYAAEPPPPAEPPRPAAPPSQSPPAEPHEDHLGSDTAEYDMELEEIEGEDVLEETPEFLQDTPDHDRLWFEQRPPKDFDFDD
jgi:hypothetical protein